MDSNTPLAYAGVGSRKTPRSMLTNMQSIATTLGTQGWTLSSGGADGADTAFEHGALGYPRQIYLPWPGYNARSGPHVHTLADEQLARMSTIASTHHNGWHRCSSGARKLHARNVAIMLGTECDTPVRAVICWTPGGLISGGTGMAIRIAKHYAIPVMNLAVLDIGTVLARMEDLAGHAGT